MLYPDYFDNNEFQTKILRLYEELEHFILQDIANRLLKNAHVTATADRLIWRLQQLGESREEILKKLQEITKLSRPMLRAMLQDAVMTSWADEEPFYRDLGFAVDNPLDNPEVRQIMDIQYKRSLGELNNLTRTTMEQSQKDLINMLSEADMRIAFGAQSPTAAICEIIDRYATQGVEVLYPTGTKRTLEAAVRCAVVTSAMQMTGQITASYIGQNGVGYVCTSAHLGARVKQKGQPDLASHDLWQGKILKIEGSEPGFPNLLELTGYTIENGTGKTVDMRGLYGWQCKHSVKPCSKDYKNPWRDKDGNLVLGGKKIDDEENKKVYEASQKARAMERSIKKTKRELLAKQTEINGIAETDVKAILQKDYDKLAYDLRTKNQKYNDFLAENNFKKEYERTKVGGFGKKQSAQANGAATRWKNQQEKDLNPERNRGIIKERIESGEYSLNLSRQQYLKHVEGTKQFEAYANSRKEKGQSPQSRITISDVEAQEIIKNKYGTGEPRIRKDGIVANVEYVNADKIVGKCYLNGEWVDTKRTAIHYGKNASHIVPVEDKNG